MNLPLKIAFHKPSQKAIHTDKADNGDKCNCICPKCKEPLTNKNNGAIRTHHFSHKTDTNCTGGQMTALHLLAQQIIVENNEITIAKDKSLSYTNGVMEKPFLDIRPDVTVNGEGEEICFEVWVKNQKNEETKKVYRDNKRRCYEINLSQMLEATYEEVERAVLFDHTTKTEIGWVDLAQVIDAAPVAKEKSFLDLLLTIGKWLLAIIAIIKFLEFLEWIFTPPKRFRR